MSERKLVDCNPSWVENYSAAGQTDAIMFECPEGHSDCKHVIPFTPALDGTPTEKYGAHRRAMNRRDEHAIRTAIHGGGVVRSTMWQRLAQWWDEPIPTTRKLLRDAAISLAAGLVVGVVLAWVLT